MDGAVSARFTSNFSDPFPSHDQERDQTMALNRPNAIRHLHASRARQNRILTAAILLAAGIVTASPSKAEDFCKPGHAYDQAKGLCYDPATAYKPDVPKGESTTGGILSGINKSLGLTGGLSLCQYGDKHVGSGDQAYCVSRRTGEAYPAGR